MAGPTMNHIDIEEISVTFELCCTERQSTTRSKPDRRLNQLVDFLDNKLTVAAFTLRMRGDIRIILSNFVNNTTISGI